MGKKTIKTIRLILHIAIFIVTTLIFLFALFSGAKPGLQGILKNIPNTLPWLFLYIINIVLIYSEIIGGSIMIILVIFLTVFFNIIPHKAWSTFFIFLFPILILGMSFIIFGALNKKYGSKNKI